MKISDNGKVIFIGAFDANKIDFSDEETVLGEDFMLRYKDESILVVEMMNDLNSFMVDMGFYGVDDGLSKFYLFRGIDDKPCLSVWCVPYLFDYEKSNERSQEIFQTMLGKSTNEAEKALIKKIMIEDEELNKECADNQRDALNDLERDGGYEITTFDIELTDAEKQQLKTVIDSMLVKAVGEKSSVL
jgi:hypothetical protein